MPAPAVLITGASSGIGRATVIACAERGWSVAATMRKPADGEDLAALPGVIVLPLDVTSQESVEAALAATLTHFGRLDGLVNNAGYAVDGVFEGTDDATIRRQFETNVFGLMRVTRAAIPLMRRQGDGTIVQVSSMGGRVTFPLYGIYHATKWAVEGFSESLAFELRPFGIRMRLVEPGAIRTEFYGRSREPIVAPPGAGYEDLVARCEAISLAGGRGGSPPEVVAATIVRAIADRGWRLRYPVAAPAPLLMRLRKLLPEEWFLRLIRRRYRIDAQLTPSQRALPPQVRDQRRDTSPSPSGRD
jgi:NAD(P)-dependent dehydrogenase (short-subunit alcohol dehydrogenase family)